MAESEGIAQGQGCLRSHKSHGNCAFTVISHMLFLACALPIVTAKHIIKSLQETKTKSFPTSKHVRTTHTVLECVTGLTVLVGLKISSTAHPVRALTSPTLQCPCTMLQQSVSILQAQKNLLNYKRDMFH